MIREMHTQICPAFTGKKEVKKKRKKEMLLSKIYREPVQPNIVVTRNLSGRMDIWESNAQHPIRVIILLPSCLVKLKVSLPSQGWSHLTPLARLLTQFIGILGLHLGRNFTTDQRDFSINEPLLLFLYYEISTTKSDIGYRIREKC